MDNSFLFVFFYNDPKQWENTTQTITYDLQNMKAIQLHPIINGDITPIKLDATQSTKHLHTSSSQFPEQESLWNLSRGYEKHTSAAINEETWNK